ncbi:DUF4269 domain-containing protein [uncultured Flavobacterium sp.]|uniref:DUF4269 domain-containing protein n=1 Tax=uncultured Flavobacterium sp. TaxID=165435 RepID=UPI0025F8DEFD|nr:DUF4269 domain-containing protein [uncultured Flavobacterium sp.]
MTDFLTINYLKSGTARQQKAFEVLNENLILQKLSDFTPVLIGTIPINIDIASSDLDIACYWKNKNHFIEIVKNNFSEEKDFQIYERKISSNEAVVANFFVNAFEIEIFGQNIPVQEQFGFRHMIIEAEILEKHGEDFRRKIIELKEQGIKTEPAFGQLLQLEGNRYEALLTYKSS